MTNLQGKLLRCLLHKSFNSITNIDLLDSHLGQHQNKMRSRKWYLHLFYHLVDTTLVNSWIVFCKVHGDLMHLADFRRAVAEGLCKVEQPGRKKRGRPSNDTEKQLQLKQSQGLTTTLQLKNVCLDALNHWPEVQSDRQRCKMPGCKSKSLIWCNKCSAFLCLNQHQNCFMKFHTL